MDYFTLDGETRTTYEVQRSVFIATVRPVETFEEGIAFAKRVAKEFSDATHNCYAFLLRNGEQKFSDDGEPQGTAGTPILQALKNNDLTNVACVVTRYFGGIKLGAGGLVAAYTKATVLALQEGKRVEKKESYVYELTVAYGDFETVRRIVSAIGGKVTKTTFSDGVDVEIALPVGEDKAFRDKINETFNGKKELTLVQTGYETY